MIKRYENSEIKKAFILPSNSGYGGFPTTCIECGCRLKKNADFDYASEWTISYTCTNCKSKFAYQPSDMGQSLAWIEKYDEKHEVI